MKVFKKMLSLIVLACISSLSDAQWFQTIYFGGSSVSTIFKTEKGTFYAGTQGGIFHSKDTLQTWLQLNDSLAKAAGGLYINDLAVSSNHIFALVNGIYRNRNLVISPDAGKNWKRANLPVVGLVPFDLEIFKETIYLSCLEPVNNSYISVLYKSTDSGTTFQKVSRLTNYYSSNTLELVGDTLFILGDSIKILYDGSTVMNFSMTGITPGSFISGITLQGSNYVIRVADRTTAYASFFKYNGVTWLNMSDGIPPMSYSGGLWEVEGNLFAGIRPSSSFEPQIYRLRNGESQWQSLDTKGLSTTFILDMVSLIPGKMIAGFDDGLYLSSDEGTTWVPANSGLTTNAAMALYINNNALISRDQYYGVFRSTNKGASFEKVNAGLPIENSYFNYFTGTNESIFAVFINSQGNELYHSDDAGSSWHKVVLPAEEFVSFIHGTGKNIFLQQETNEGRFTYYSTNKGIDWQDISTNFPKELVDKTGIKGEGDTLYFYGSDSYQTIFPKIFYRSTNGGLSWDQDNNGLAGADPANYLYNTTISYAGNKFYIAYFNTNEKKLHLYTRGKDKWTLLMGTIPFSLVAFGIYEYEGILYVSTDLGIYISKDEGKTFEYYSDGLLKGVVPTGMVFLNDQVFLSTDGNGVWSNQAVKNPSGVSRKLNQAFIATACPNPAGSYTELHFNTNRKGPVSIQLTDVTGKLIYYYNYSINQIGKQGFNLNLLGLSEGTYTCTLITEEGVARLQMIHIE